MIRRVIEAVREYDMFSKGERVLCAVSGGADSVALLFTLREVSDVLGIERLAVAHFNHRLRGEESDRDEAFVRELAQKNGFDFICDGADVAKEAASCGGGIEETARRLRYRFLERAARELGCGRIATAHTASDNLETVIMNLMRGAGINGLSGIPPKRGSIVRPAIYATREDVLLFLEKNGLAHVEDSTNSDLNFMRNRIRHVIIPVMKAVNPNLEETVGSACRGIRDDSAYLDLLAEQVMGFIKETREGMVVNAQDFASLNPSLTARAVKRICDSLDGNGAGLGYGHISAVIRLAKGCDPSARIDLPGRIIVSRRYDELVFSRQSELPQTKQDIKEVNVAPGQKSKFGERYCIFCERIAEFCKEESGDTVFIDEGKVQGTLRLRSRKTGDVISGAGRKTKTIKKLFIDMKIPATLREEIPVVCDDLGVAAVFGYGADRRCAPEPGGPALKLTLKKGTGI